jgi:hypothetical protein
MLYTDPQLYFCLSFISVVLWDYQRQTQETNEWIFLHLTAPPKYFMSLWIELRHQNWMWFSRWRVFTQTERILLSPKFAFFSGSSYLHKVQHYWAIRGQLGSYSLQLDLPQSLPPSHGLSLIIFTAQSLCPTFSSELPLPLPQSGPDHTLCWLL